MTASTKTLTSIVGLACAGAVMAGSTTLAGSAASGAHTTAHSVVSAAAASGSVDAHPVRLAGRVAATQLPDSPAAARARGEAKASATAASGSQLGASARALPRTQDAVVRNTAESRNWSGVVGTGRQGTFSGAAGAWYVPQVHASRQDRYGSTWVGVDDGNRTLIQAGAEEDYIADRAFYAAWWEILPANEVRITLNGSLAPVAPGDLMYCYVYQTSPGVYRIFLDDQTQRWYYDSEHYHRGPGLTTEWIQEGSEVRGKISRPTNFGAVGFGNLYVDEGNTWYRTAFGATDRINIVQRGVRYTKTSTPTRTSPQTFTVRYTGP